MEHPLGTSVRPAGLQCPEGPRKRRAARESDAGQEGWLDPGAEGCRGIVRSTFWGGRLNQSTEGSKSTLTPGDEAREGPPAMASLWVQRRPSGCGPRLGLWAEITALQDRRKEPGEFAPPHLQDLPVSSCGSSWPAQKHGLVPGAGALSHALETSCPAGGC